MNRPQEYIEQNTIIGRKFREVRLVKGMSQSEIGHQLHVSCQQIQKYERGKDTIPLPRLLKAASLWNINPAFLWSDVPSFEDGVGAGKTTAAEDIDDKSILALIKAYKRIRGAETRKKVLDLIRSIAGMSTKSS